MKKGFTLIELLIVVAIIAILAAIAVPNFLEAQTRSRVSRVQNDLRTIALAMESYYVDNSSYPVSRRQSWLYPGNVVHLSKPHLTTPIAYINSVPDDIFRQYAGLTDISFSIYGANYGTKADGSRVFEVYPYTAWMTWSYGPDTNSNCYGYFTYPQVLANEALGDQGHYGLLPESDQYIAGTGPAAGLRYDPTNGTISHGDLYRHDGEAKIRTR